jgi:AAA+ ATPase superfamily predicted ATPase
MASFVGRADELELLDNLWHQEGAKLLILYGRRRVGKTRLLTHWLKEHGGSGLYWVAEPTSQLSQLRSFSQALFNFTSPRLTAPSDFTYANWEQAFHQVALIAAERRVAIFIDELGYLLDATPSFAGILQNAWDHALKPTNVVLALSGSQMSVIQGLFDYSGPLYGRASAVIRLPQLEYSAMQQYFPTLDAADRVRIYAIWGGVPAYWELISANQPLLENIRSSFLRSNMLMQQEPLLLLQDFISDPHNYIGILNALASGAVTRARISTQTGLPDGHMSKYLGVLRDTGFVDRVVPVTEDPGRSRRGHYRITDPLLRFYYRFLPKHNARLALGEQEEILASIASDLPSFVEENTWHELCREWIVKASWRGFLPLRVTEAGGAWYRRTNIPIVAVDHAQKHIVFGSGIWNSQPASLTTLSAVLTQSETIMGTLEEPDAWEVYYVGIAAGGWRASAQSDADRLIREGTADFPWQTRGVKLLDLAQLDADLAAWSEFETLAA